MALSGPALSIIQYVGTRSFRSIHTERYFWLKKKDTWQFQRGRHGNEACNWRYQEIPLSLYPSLPLPTTHPNFSLLSLLSFLSISLLWLCSPYSPLFPPLSLLFPFFASPPPPLLLPSSFIFSSRSELPGTWPLKSWKEPSISRESPFCALTSTPWHSLSGRCPQELKLMEVSHVTSYKFRPSWSGAQTSPSLVPRPHPAFCLGSGGMSYCNQTPFSLREGGVWAWDYVVLHSRTKYRSWECLVDHPMNASL